jgi:hypothetical protein
VNLLCSTDHSNNLGDSHKKHNISSFGKKNVFVLIVVVFLLLSSCNGNKASNSNTTPTVDTTDCSVLEITTEEHVNCGVHTYECEAHALCQGCWVNCVDKSKPQTCSKKDVYQREVSFYFQNNQLLLIPDAPFFVDQVEKNTYKYVKTSDSPELLIRFTSTGYRAIITSENGAEGCSNDPDKGCMYSICTIID